MQGIIFIGMKQYIKFLTLVLVTFFSIKAQTQIRKGTNMKVAAEIYLIRKDGKVMHFDIIAPEEIKYTSVIYGYGKKYLKTKGQEGQTLTANECSFATWQL